MTQAKLRIGQVIYGLIKTQGANGVATKLFPMMVVEEMTRKTISGVETAYMVQVPGVADVQRLDNVCQSVFVSTQDAFNALMNQARSNVEKLINGAVRRAVEAFPNSQSNDEPTQGNIADETQGKPPVQEQPQATDDEYQIIELPDGRRAKVKSSVPPELL